MPERLSVRDLSVRFGAASVLRNVDLEVEPGDVIGLVGPNGSGKSTTLRAICGLIVPSAGSIEVDGVRYAGRPDRIVAAGVSYVPEGRGIFGGLTVRQNIAVGALGAGHRLRAPDETRILELFPRLQPLADTTAGLLSGGEQQMLAIARGLAARPTFLLTDELSLGLSPAMTRSILELLVAQAREHGLGLLLVDQNAALLDEFCSALHVLRRGELVHSVTAHDAVLREAYFGSA
ncbi:ATP-binding cassette domain-containing protein [Pseudonocardia kujensis]|uniref:ABC transporter ATP-binding protein n=1 Tax=Pseudonocardia kujensis TaxID=1128675 RepID=UPI001E560BA3|nr:ATP-binding cassette domain-containing protein [Pseudonocardia kujensis]MCE0767620.1 ATP-binding cassette domain-containing protein [Pseudonocardia kujensis]